jgi:biotin carboxyl carrier protein
MKKYMIKLNGKVYEVEMEEVTGEASATILEKQSSAPVAEASATIVERQSPAQPSAPVAGAENVEAPMPGTIVNVAVKVGDKVKKNQVLVVLEAMKMENEIVASRDAEVVSINVSKGDTVNPGQLLVQIA